MPNVAFQRPEYVAMKPRWDLITDCIEGEQKIKAALTKYLPQPNATDKSPENTARYEQYVERAVFYNVTGRTLHGLVGHVMADDPAITLPKALEVIEDDADGGGVRLTQQAQSALSMAVAYGRCGLLVDYPTTGAPATRRQIDSGEVRPTISLYGPHEIINWRMVQVNGRSVLASVVLSELAVKEDDGFEQKYKELWRVLALVDSVYHIQTWERGTGKPEGTDVGVEFVKTSDVIPLDASGKAFDSLPWFFIGSRNNDPTVDLPPLYDLASMNLAHYRNSADYEEACYICGQPTPYFSGLTEEWVSNVMKGQVRLGSRSAVLLPVDGDAGLLQVEENTMPKEAMEAKERQMVALGAQVVQDKAVQRTATEASIETSAERSTLANAANNVSLAYRDALATALCFVDATIDEPSPEELVFKLNTNFRSAQMTSQERAQLVAEWQAGAILDEEMRSNLTRAGVATVELEQWKTQREEEAMSRPIMAQSGNSPSETDPETGEVKPVAARKPGQPPGSKE